MLIFRPGGKTVMNIKLKNVTKNQCEKTVKAVNKTL